MTIPMTKEVKIVATKGDTREEFNSWKEFEEWCFDLFDEYYAESYQQLYEDSDHQTGYEDARDWLRNGATIAEIEEAAWENDWKIERVPV